MLIPIINNNNKKVDDVLRIQKHYMNLHMHEGSQSEYVFETQI